MHNIQIKPAILKRDAKFGTTKITMIAIVPYLLLALMLNLGRFLHTDYQVDIGVGLVMYLFYPYSQLFVSVA